MDDELQEKLGYFVTQMRKRINQKDGVYKNTHKTRMIKDLELLLKIQCEIVIRLIEEGSEDLETDYKKELVDLANRACVVYSRL